MSDFAEGMRVQSQLEDANQTHLIKFYDELDAEGKAQLEADLIDLEIDQLDHMFKAAKMYKPPNADALKQVVPARTGNSASPDAAKWTRVAYDLMNASKIGVVLLAGGQGTRLGSANPKGMYNIGLPSQKSLFQIQCERLLRVETMAGGKGTIPLYVMTSAATRQKTESFFIGNNYFGLKPDQIMFFDQGTHPCFDMDGKVLLSTKSSIARSPDGNGGIYLALKKQGVLDNMRKKGLYACHIYCVDNSLVKVADPVFVGFCAQLNADCGNKSVVKTEPSESVGVVVRLEDGTHGVVEYSELSKKSSERRDEDGQLTLRAGNICNHYMTVDFLEEIATKPMPFHIAKKKIPTVDMKTGDAIKPEQANGIKLEKFIFDVFAYSKSFALLEVDRIDEFSPLKNANTAKKDCPISCCWDVMNMRHRQLVAAGAKLIVDGVEAAMPERPVKTYPDKYPFEIEINPAVSYGGEGLEQYRDQELTPPIIL